MKILIIAAILGISLIVFYSIDSTKDFSLLSQEIKFMKPEKPTKKETPENTTSVYYRFGNRGESKIALTFDDGPSPVFTPEVLDIFKRYNVHATFFTLGKWAEQHPDIIKRMKNEGHLVGNHGYSHEKGIGDFEKSEEILFDILGEKPKFLRPPYGDLIPISKEIFLENKVINWDTEARDWERPAPEVIAQRILSTAQNGSIILLHDGSRQEAEQKERPQNMVRALPKIIEELNKKFNLVRVDELDLTPIPVKR